MEFGTTNFSRETVRLELAGRILADLLRLGTVLGPEATFRAVGRNVPAIPGRTAPSLNKQVWELGLDDIDIDQFPMGRLVMATYDYVYQQQYPTGLPMHVFEGELEHLEDFAISLNSDLFSLFLRDSVHTGGAGEAEWKALPALYFLAKARLRLDMGEELELNDIALLADMAIKSVRNAINATGEGRLQVDNLGSGYETVDNDEARRWLSQRRGFKPTQFKEMKAIAGEHPESIGSLFELGCYIDERWAAFGKTPETVLAELAWPTARFDYLNKITGEPQEIDPRDCPDLARSLLVSESWFTEQVLRNLYPRQVDQLVSRVPREAGEAQELPLAPVSSDRLCERVRFILYDGTVLYPVRMKNRQTGKVAFRLSKGGTGGNTMDQAIEIEDEAQMVDLVCNQGLAVRLQSANADRHGLYRKDGRSVRTVELDGVVI